MRNIFLSCIGLCFIFFYCNEPDSISDKNKATVKHKYYKSGKVESISPYDQQGLLHGTQIFYFENGNPRKSINWVDNKIVGSYLEFYETGKPKVYLFYNFDQNVIFKRTFSEEGALIADSGEIFPLSITDLNKAKEGVLESVVYNLTPPKTNVSVAFYLIGKSDSLKVDSEVRDGVYKINKQFDITKFQEFGIKAFIVDSLKNIKWDQLNLIKLSQ